MARNEKCKESILAQRAVARRHLHAVSEAWALQTTLGGHCHAENPLSSEAWGELTLGDVYAVRVDQCALGLRCPKNRLPVLKPTQIATTQESLAEALACCRCDHRHEHGHLEGKYKGVNLSKVAETYPTKFCNVVSHLIVEDIRSVSSAHANPADCLFAIDAVEDESGEPVDAPASGESDDPDKSVE